MDERDKIMAEKAGKIINIKIDEALHKRLKILASMQGKTIKELTTEIVQDYCDKNEKSIYAESKK